MKNTLRAAFALLVISLCAAALPARGDAPPQVYAKAYILMEPLTGRVLAARNERGRIYPASMTKALTALILLEYFKPDEVVVCGPEINSVPFDSSKARLAEGEGITIENLVRALMIESGGDAACVAAAAVARRAAPDEDTGTYARCEKIFRRMMNERALALGCEGSNFIKPDGYHDENHFSTAYDIALIGRAAMANAALAGIAAEAGFEGDSAPPSPEYTVARHKWTNRNLLVSGGAEFYPYATGFKTGATDEAGECLLATAERDGVTLIAVTCDSPVLDEDGVKKATRWGDNKALFEWGFENYHFETIQTDGDALGDFPVSTPRLGAEETLPLFAVGGARDFLSKAELGRVERAVTIEPAFAAYDDETGETPVVAPIEAGQAIGRVTYTLDGRQLFTGAAVAGAEVLPRTFNSDVDYYVALWKARLFGRAALPWWIVGGLSALVLVLLIYIAKGGRKRRSPFN